MLKQVQRTRLSPDFGKAKPVTQVRPRWVRTDWDTTAAIGIGIGSATLMIGCFYLLFSFMGV